MRKRKKAFQPFCFQPPPPAATNMEDALKHLALVSLSPSPLLTRNRNCSRVDDIHGLGAANDRRLVRGHFAYGGCERKGKRKRSMLALSSFLSIANALCRFSLCRLQRARKRCSRLRARARGKMKESERRPNSWETREREAVVAVAVKKLVKGGTCRLKNKKINSSSHFFSRETREKKKLAPGAFLFLRNYETHAQRVLSYLPFYSSLSQCCQGPWWRLVLSLRF